MFWLVLIAGGAGFLLGLWKLRAGFIALVSAVLLMICAGASPFLDWGLVLGVGFTLALLGALQGGYLAGLIASGAWAVRAKAPQTILKSSHIDQCRT